MNATCSECGSTILRGLPAYLLDGRELCRNCRDEAEPMCPNCGEIMRRKLPKTYGKCPACEGRFHVDRHQFLFDSMLTTAAQHDQVKRLERAVDIFSPWGFTRQTAHQLTIVARREYGEASIDATMSALTEAFARVALKDHPAVLEVIGAKGVERAVEAVFLLADVRGDAKDQLVPLCRVCEELSSQFQMMPSARDIAWSFLQHEELAAAQRGAPLRELIGLKDQMMSFVRNEGRDSRHIQREYFRLKCQEAKMSNVVKGVRVGPPRPNACPAADKLAGRLYSLDEAIQNPPVPSDDCTYSLGDGEPPWCACCLLFETFTLEDLE